MEFLGITFRDGRKDLFCLVMYLEIYFLNLMKGTLNLVIFQWVGKGY